MSIEKLYNIFKTAYKGVTTDSRNCEPGMLFFALKGDNFDGNKFAKQAIDAGCVGAVVDDKSLSNEAKVIVVDDVLTAMQNLAKLHRRQFDIPVIGLTGSNGKTTTKELITAVLSKYFKVHSTKGNLNNHIGVPLTILSMPSDCEILIVEMGASHLGEIKALAEITEPTYGLITNIGLAHLEGFGGKDGVIKGKKELFDFLQSRNGSTAFVNVHHPILLDISKGINRIVYGSFDEPPYVKFEIESEGRCFVWAEENYQSKPNPIQLEGDYNLENIAAAIAVGRHFKVGREEIERAISEYVPSNNRSQTVKTSANEIILDAYNANPSSMEKALSSFAEHVEEPRIVILGEMRELGQYAHKLHSELVALCSRLELDAIFVGKEYVDLNTVIPDNVYASVEELMEFWQNNAIKGKTILLKGSRGMAMERLLPLL